MNETYTATECPPCGGTGTRHDPTDADKVNAGPFAGRCASCQGRGSIFTLDLAPAAYLAVERDAARPDWDAAGALPDWMTG